jgi:hypothetical protein
MKTAIIASGIGREISTTAGCDLSTTCCGALHIRLGAELSTTVHLHEDERVALIEALGGTQAQKHLDEEHA